jgi:hypothetical protein
MMRDVGRLSLLTLGAVITVVTVAEAAHPQTIGRYLGIGWGDGYHAPACPPHRGRRAAPPAAIPWWMLPSSTEPSRPPAEPLPPAAPLSESGRAADLLGGRR